MLKIQEFLKNNPDNWEELLTQPPYSLKIVKSDDRVLFSYKQGISDYNQEIVREARGLILNVHTFDVLCMAFKKFFICDSPFADNVDWQNICVEDKLDGTLITLYHYNNEWIPATTGTLDIRKAPICQGFYTDFGKLLKDAVINSGLDYSKLNPDYCYMFELISPYNQLVVRYNETKLIHIGTRDRTTLLELDTDIGIEKPKLYEITNLEDALSVVNSSNFCGEGFVVVDKDYNRVKVKSETWFKLHYMVNNNVINISHALDIILSDDVDEFISHYPHYRPYFSCVKKALKSVNFSVNDVINLAKTVKTTSNSRKVQAEYWNNFMSQFKDKKEKRFMQQCKTAYFSTLDDDSYTFNNFLQDKFRNQIEEMVEYFFKS